MQAKPLPPSEEHGRTGTVHAAKHAAVSGSLAMTSLIRAPYSAGSSNSTVQLCGGTVCVRRSL